MTLQSLPAHNSVMEYGDVGDNFYFILTGECEIHLPDSKRMDQFKQAKRDA
jgi:CRP-like cAMP-binding protein